MERGRLSFDVTEKLGRLHYSVMELFVAGGNYPASEVPFPIGFASAVDAEITAAK